ncbi:DUF4136 domain-containing protein [Allosphingosinicella sp.]|jgi:hypothetical protein|uniref:DUF4136 domain-containing protein n=1 Tax=Allosphingosinicella sp. TaxID=2823234 RepID=UPI002EFB7580
MSLQKKLLTFAAPIALLGLSACATGLPTEVSRFQAMPAPQGESFVIVPDEGNKGGLEFSQYAGLVRQHLVSLGYNEAPSRQAASFVVELDYGVDEGRDRVVARHDPFPRFGRPYGYGYGYGRPYYPRFGYYGRHRSPFYYGWHDPYLYDDGLATRLESYTVYTSHLDMEIRRTADGQSLFEGRAEARSRDDDLTELVPNLVEAMFTDFPGRSGETVRITVPTKRR